MGRSWLCLLAAALTVARNWASSSGKLAVYSSFTMHMYSGKAMALNSWEYKYLSLDASLLLIKTSAGLIVITNIYNPRQKGQPILSC